MSNLIRLSDVQRREVMWLEHGTIPRGMLSILAGHPGLGKSLWSVALAARVSIAGHTVVICSAEDSLEHSIKPRLQAAGADTTGVHALVPTDEDGNPRGVSFPTDAAILLAAIREVDAVLAIVDPITAQLDQTVDSHRDASLRSALAPLHRIAEETTAALLAVFHLNKSTGSDPMMRLGGSIGGPGQARSALLLDRDPDDRDGPRRVLAHFKSNVGPLQPSRLLEVTAVHLPVSDLEPAIDTAKIVDAGESKHTASALLASGGEDRSAVDDAADFLQEELRDGLEMETKTIRKRARELGISDRTLDRAKQRLGVTSKKSGFGNDGMWAWQLRTPKDASRAGDRNLAYLDDDEAHLRRNGADPTKDAAEAVGKALHGEDGGSR